MVEDAASQSGSPRSPASDTVLLAIDGRAYSIGRDFPHPGGWQVLEQLHGRDATAEFRGLHGGHAHSAAAELLLQSFHLGSADLLASGGAGAAPERPAASAGPALGGSRLIDETKPLLYQVPRLSPDQYQQWVHAPAAGAPRFFQRDWMELCTKVKWWVVPALWLPLVAWQLVLAARHLPWAGAAAVVALGVVLWQLMEYSLHRWAFHARPAGPCTLFLHFLLHGCHHKYPQDVDRLVFPPLPASWVIAAIYAAFQAALPQAVGRALFAGMLLGYVAYDCAHYAMHSGALGGPLRAAHMTHHYAASDANYGISSPLWDLLLGTWAGRGGSSRASSAVRREPPGKAD